MNDDRTPVARPTARLVVLDPEDRVLLFRIEDDTVADPGDPRRERRPFDFWVLPGGGVDAGESYEAAARRELREETGIDAEPGALLFEHEVLLLLNGEPVLFQERFYLVRAAVGEVSLSGLNALEQAVYRDHRWWTLAELTTTSETFFPDELIEIVRRALSAR